MMETTTNEIHEQIKRERRNRKKEKWIMEI
jgi:hypothetical protein